MNSSINSGLKAFCTEISLKNGGNKDFRLSRRTWLVPICLNFFAMKTNAVENATK